MKTTIYRLGSQERTEAASRYIEQRVRVVLKDPFFPRVGRVVCVANTLVLNTADVLVLQVDHPDPDKRYVYPEAISLAQIRWIESL